MSKCRGVKYLLDLCIHTSFYFVSANNTVLTYKGEHTVDIHT